MFGLESLGASKLFLPRVLEATQRPVPEFRSLVRLFCDLEGSRGWPLAEVDSGSLIRTPDFVLTDVVAEYRVYFIAIRSD